MNILVSALLMLFAAITSAGAQAPKDKMIIASGIDPAFAQFYVGKAGGFFEKNGLDVTLNTGASGSAMVPFLIKNQVQAVVGAEQAGLLNFAVDEDVVLASQMLRVLRYYGVVGRNIDDLDGLKGKKIGMTPGGAGELFWNTLVSKLNLDPADYTVVPVDSPEMVAALERGNLDAVATWEPWVTRSVEAVSGAKLLRDNEGILFSRNFLYLNRSWAEENPETAARFMRALADATDFIHANPDEAAKLVAEFTSMDAEFVKKLMPKIDFEMLLDRQDTIEYLTPIEEKLKSGDRLTKDIAWDRYIYPTVIEAVLPSKIK
jgi:NitT/TauT family transport system substrate-binding protein